MRVNLQGKTALITGGTMGIGLATALALSRHGAQCTITYKWGTADLDEVRKRFSDAGASPPLILEADAGEDADLDPLLDQIHERHQQIDIFVSNVSVSLLIKSLEDYSLRALNKSLEYSAWPLLEYSRRIRAKFGRYPRYVIGMSSPGPDHFMLGYDFVAISKAVLETMCRYMSYRLFDEGTRINIVRSQAIRTESWYTTFPGFEAFAKPAMSSRHFVDVDEVANVVVALCSGYADGMTGQVIAVNRGISQFDNLVNLYRDRQRRQQQQ